VKPTTSSATKPATPSLNERRIVKNAIKKKYIDKDIYMKIPTSLLLLPFSLWKPSSTRKLVKCAEIPSPFMKATLRYTTNFLPFSMEKNSLFLSLLAVLNVVNKED
jgi:hypothetical protein